MEHSALLAEIYSDPRQPGSFTSADKLSRTLKKLKNVSVKVESVRNWLKSKDTYTKHRVARTMFKRNPIIAPYINAQWQGDLADVANLAGKNDGIRYLLVMIDVVSKYVWVEPLKTKQGKSVLEALKTIFARAGVKPERIQTDDGKEFLDGGVQDFLKQNKIRFFTVKSDKKAAIAERVIRTLKEKLYRYMHEAHTHRYLDVLQDLVASYNDTYHSSIKMSPAEVSESTEGEVLQNLYGMTWEKDQLDNFKSKTQRKLTLKEGDFVRISRVKGPFKKGYIGNWTEEIFIIDKVKNRVPKVMYKLKDWGGEVLQGSFYEEEVQLVDKDLGGFWKVERVIRSKKVNGRLKHYVKWEGYHDDVNSWVDASDVKNL